MSDGREISRGQRRESSGDGEQTPKQSSNDDEKHNESYEYCLSTPAWLDNEERTERRYRGH
jgi:hypothetical protein